MQAVGNNLSLNQFLASAANQQAVQQFRAQDAAIRGEAAKKAAAAGAGASVVTNLKYSVGPDGQLYATGGTVSTSRKVQGNEYTGQVSGYTSDAQNDNRQQIASGPQRQARFGDFLPPQVAISPLQFAQLQEERDNDGLAQARLQQADAAVRGHERQHFFAAGGLVEGLPQYQYAVGPDGQLYAVAGQVQVSTTPTTDPEQASRDAAALARAATAPGDTSAQDINVAQSASSSAASLYSQYNRANQLSDSGVVDIAA